jgi:pimeloyl-ACP methyl ester carboxylesterase
MVSVEGAGVPLAVRDDGAGPATVLVHGMGGTAWPREALDGRVVEYDRRGYGGSGAPDPYVRTTVQEHAEDLVCVVEQLEAAPALLAGADFGALVVLDVLLRHPALARAAVLVDPPAYMFVPEATEALSGRVAALQEELRAGGPALLAERRGELVDFGAIATLPLSHTGLRDLAVPVTIVSSPAAQHHDLAAAEALLEAIPGASGAATVEDALRRASA